MRQHGGPMGVLRPRNQNSRRTTFAVLSETSSQPLAESLATKIHQRSSGLPETAKLAESCVGQGFASPTEPSILTKQLPSARGWRYSKCSDGVRAIVVS